MSQSVIRLWEKRWRATALQDAMRDTMILEIREASWSAPALWRCARRRNACEISSRFEDEDKSILCLAVVVQFGIHPGAGAGGDEADVRFDAEPGQKLGFDFAR